MLGEVAGKLELRLRSWSIVRILKRGSGCGKKRRNVLRRGNGLIRQDAGQIQSWADHSLHCVRGRVELLPSQRSLVHGFRSEQISHTRLF